MLKEQIIKSIRDFFSARGLREIIIPIFNTSLPLEPNIYAFRLGKYYLPTSPEATLKKKIAQGIGNCFAVGHTFRDLEDTSSIHSPEFLMLEWYRENADYRRIITDTRQLIIFIKEKIKSKTLLPEKWQEISMEQVFRKYARLNLSEIIDDKMMIKVAAEKGYSIKNTTWEQIFNQIFLNEVEPHLPKEPFFLTDYPAKISPLCAKRTDKPYLAQRFELYIGGVEIANGNSENTDAEGILRSMKEEEKYRKKRGILSPPVDMEFIEALRKMHGKNYAGSGLGVERLAMVLGGIEDISQLE